MGARTNEFGACLGEDKAGDQRVEIIASLLLPVDWKFEEMPQRCIDSYQHIPQHVRKAGNRHYPRPLQQANLAALQAFQNTKIGTMTHIHPY